MGRGVAKQIPAKQLIIELIDERRRRSASDD
jgi:hypothetical protein